MLSTTNGTSVYLSQVPHQMQKAKHLVVIDTEVEWTHPWLAPLARSVTDVLYRYHDLVHEDVRSKRSDGKHHGTSTISLLETYGADSSGLVKFAPGSIVDVIAVKSSDALTKVDRVRELKSETPTHRMLKQVSFSDAMDLAKDLFENSEIQTEDCALNINLDLPLHSFGTFEGAHSFKNAGIPSIVGGSNDPLPAKLGLAGAPDFYGIGAYGPVCKQLIGTSYENSIVGLAPGHVIYTASASASPDDFCYSKGTSYSAPIALAMILVEHDQQPNMLAALNAILNRAALGILTTSESKIGRKEEEVAGKGFTGIYPDYAPRGVTWTREVVCCPGKTPNLALRWGSCSLLGIRDDRQPLRCGECPAALRQ
ncbi:hypothetical protein LTR49_026566 [Elasticomyces elasticus]|nr:hypothetical protein LTR49_026566 [Elasticomyces elasticus]